MRTTLADRVKLARTSVKERKKLKYKVTQADLASECGLTRHSLWKIENGETTHPRDQTIEKLATVLRVNKDWLVHGAGVMDEEAPDFREKQEEEAPISPPTNNRLLHNQTVVLVETNPESNKNWKVIVPSLRTETVSIDLAPNIDLNKLSKETIVQADLLTTDTHEGEQIFILNITY